MLPSVLTSISINRLRCFIALNAFRSFDATALEKALVGCVLLDVRGLALLCRIDVSLLAKLRARDFGVITRSFLTMVRHRDRRQVSMFRHRFLANCGNLPRRVAFLKPPSIRPPRSELP